MSNKQALLKNLKDDTYCRIMPSKTHGVGVHAIKNIPKGVNPFKRLGKETRPVKITEGEYKSLPAPVQKLIRDFSQKDDGHWYVPDVGFNGIDVSFYLNHNTKPNVKICCDRETSYFVYFKTLREIKKGEELLIDYKT